MPSRIIPISTTPPPDDQLGPSLDAYKLGTFGSGEFLIRVQGEICSVRALGSYVLRTERGGPDVDEIDDSPQLVDLLNCSKTEQVREQQVTRTTGFTGRIEITGSAMITTEVEAGLSNDLIGELTGRLSTQVTIGAAASFEVKIEESSTETRRFTIPPCTRLLVMVARIRRTINREVVIQQMERVQVVRCDTNPSLIGTKVDIPAGFERVVVVRGQRFQGFKETTTGSAADCPEGDCAGERRERAPLVDAPATPLNRNGR